MAIVINDVTLPDIPSDVLASYPYAVVLSSVDSEDKTTYVLAVSNSSVFHGNGSLFGQGNADGVGSFGAGATYYAPLGGNAWTSLGAIDTGKFVTALGVVDGMTLSFVWSNHNILELTSYDPMTGEYTTGSIWFAKSVDGSEEELVATHFYYNTVLLPEIPGEVLKTHPYCWIRTNSQTGYYDLVMSSSPWWKADATTITTANYAEGIQWYRVLISGSGYEWNFNQSWTESGDFAVDTNRPILWSNHNIPVGSVSASEIYFNGSTPIPVVESYDIRRDSLAGIANQVRRLCKTSESLTPARMKARLAGLNIELQAAQVTSSDEEQVIYPDEGYYGFSSITVGAVQTGGSTGGGGTPGEGGEGGDTEENYISSDYVQFGAEITECPMPVDDGSKYQIIVVNEKGASYLFTSTVVIKVGTNWGTTNDTWYFNVGSEGGDRYEYPLSGGAWGNGISVGYSYTIESNNPSATLYTVIYTSHDLINQDTGEVWMEASEPYSDTVAARFETPVVRDETYTIEGEKLNDLILSAQKITGTNKPMTPDEAIEALENYGTRPSAEGESF